MSAFKPQGRLYMTVEPDFDSSDLLITVSGLRVRDRDGSVARRISEAALDSWEALSTLTAAACGASAVVEAATRSRQLAERSERKALADVEHWQEAFAASCIGRAVYGMARP